MFIISDIKGENYARVNMVVEVYFPKETWFLKLYFVLYSFLSDFTGDSIQCYLCSANSQQ